MNLKNFSLLALAAALAIAFAGCAQDSTNTTDDNPAMQEQVAKGEGASGASAAATQSTAAPKAAGGTSKVALSSDPSGALKYDTTELSAKAGNVAIAFTNSSSTPHNVTVTGDGGKKLGATKDVTNGHGVLALKGLKAGTYTFFCSIPGHEQAGMKGTLTVK
jgi:plastocyanin